MDTPLRIRRIADPRQLSQGKVAAAVGVDASFYSRLESGDAHASAELAQSIADYFGVPVADIFTPSRYASAPEATEIEA